ncbi:MAG: penicillin-binding protein activator [Gammaproteobacteria bacterium]
MKRTDKLNKYSSWAPLIIATSLIISCTTTAPTNNLPQPVAVRHYEQPADHYLQQADKPDIPQQQAQSYELKAAGRLLQDGNEERASQLINDIKATSLPQDLRDERILLQGQLALFNNKPLQTINLLSQLKISELLQTDQQAEYYYLLASAYENTGDHWKSTNAYIELEPLVEASTTQSFVQQKIWYNLLRLDQPQLQKLQTMTLPSNQSGWITLADIAENYAQDWPTMRQAIDRWQDQYPDHPANNKFKESIAKMPDHQPPQQIALMLPSQGDLAGPSNAIREGFMAAYYQTRQDKTIDTNVRFYDSSQGSKIISLYQQALDDGADFIIGPLDKSKAQTLANYRSISVPTLVLNYAKTRQPTASNLYQFGLSPNNEAVQAAQRAWQNGHRRALLITPAGQWGENIADSFTEQWLQLGGIIVDQLAYTETQDLNTATQKLLKVDQSIARAERLEKSINKAVSFTPHRRQDTDMIFLAAFPDKARQIHPLLKYYYGGDLPVYAPSLIYSGQPDQMRDNDLNGIIFSDMPWVLDQTQQSNNKSLNIDDFTRLYALGYDSYNLTNQLNQLTVFSDLGIQGKTGLLYLNQQQQVERQLQWAQFKNGTPSQRYL